MENYWWFPTPNEVEVSELLVPESQPTKKENDMKPKKPIEPCDDLRPEYDFDFSKAERGRYAQRLMAEGSNLVLVDPELTEAFPDSASVNAALRSVVEFAELSAGLTRRSIGRTTKRRTA